jgi:hypothetical protein
VGGTDDRLLSSVSILVWASHDRIEKPPAWPAFRPAGKLKHAPPKASVFHEVSRAEGPSQQDRKTSSANGRLAPWVGQALPPANRSGSDQELAGESACPTIFHEISRAAGPSQQTTKCDGLSHYAFLATATSRGASGP